LKTFGLVVNINKKGVQELVGRISRWIQDKGCDFLLVDDIAAALGFARFGVTLDELIERAQYILVLGGDGTMLWTARQVASAGTPVLGINLGHLGFLTEIDLHEILPALENIMEGKYRVEERMMLEATVFRQGRIVENSLGLNDAIITKGSFSRIIHLEAYIKNELVNNYYADGMIVASPTGSIAYSLSAGGPLVTPEQDLLLMTPVCPHSLWARPVVIAPESEIKLVVMSNHGEVMLTMDGQHGFSLHQHDQVVIKRAAHKARFLRLLGRSFFEVLRNKL
jgi:NAD+ kinase